jgi:PAS domain S-box-containing protein
MSPGTHRSDLLALLRAQHAVSAVLGAASPGDDAVAAVLPTIAEALGWGAGVLWEPLEDGSGRLGCRAVWSARSLDLEAWEAACRTAVLGPGDGLPGAALASGAPEWSRDASTGLPHARAAARAGLHASICLPLLATHGAVGAIEFFLVADGDPDAELLETVASFGRQIGQCAERGRTEAQLRRSDAYRRAVLNAAFDAIVAMDADGMIIDANAAAEKLFGRTAPELLDHELAATIIPSALRDAHRRGLADYLAGGAQRVLGHPVELTAMRGDGREFPVEVAIRRLEVPGPPIFIGFIRDLTARHAAEREVRQLAEEQAALRRVATLVARGADQASVFAAVTEEVARLCAAHTANMIRYQDDDTAVVIGAWSQDGGSNVPLGAVVPLDGNTAGPLIRRTGRPVRVDLFVPGTGRLDAALSSLGFTAAVGAPVVLDGELWGAVILRSNTGPFPAGAEYRLQAFAELAAQALANAEAREQLTASRARLVTVGMAERRRLERNLHDGAQQRLVALAMLLRLATQTVERTPAQARRHLELAQEELGRALSDLRELARGLHPAILSDRGLEAAIQTLCTVAPVPVGVDIDLSREPCEAVQAAAYFLVAEALTNIAKYAQATSASVSVREQDGSLRVEVIDDGVGGAEAGQGSGLSGLADRVEALGGRLIIESPRGQGTRIHAELANPDHPTS